MKITTTTFIVSAAAIALFPIAAEAGEMPQKTVTESTSTTDAPVTLQDEARLVVTPQVNQEVLSAVTTSQTEAGLIPIEHEGQIYFNRVVDDSELKPVDYNVDVVDTYTYEYQGRTYTNKVVAD